MKGIRPFDFAVVTAAVVVVIGLMLWVGANPDAVRADNSAPAAPTNLALASQFWTEQGGMKLTWTAPEGTVTGYQILRQRSGCDDSLQVYVEDTGSVSTAYTDFDVADGVTYVYSVKAIKSGTVGPQSDSASQEYFAIRSLLGPFNAGALRPPSELASRNLRRGIELTWEKPPGEPTGYQILRRSPEHCERMQVYVENTDSTDTRWIDTDAENGTLYEYTIASINEAGAGYRSYPPTEIEKREARAGIVMAGLFEWVFRGGSTTWTIAFNHHDPDYDADTVDFTIRGDVTLDTDGSNADECEGDRLGEDIQINTVDETVEQFEFTFGGSGCRTIGSYSLRFVVTDRDDDVVTFSPFTRTVIGPIISGTAQVGETLTADVSSIVATEHWASSTFTYQWIRIDDGTSESNISGATGATYTLVDADEGKTIKVLVDYTNELGQRQISTSAPTAPVAAPPNNVATGAPTISGTAQVDETLTADTSGITDADGLANASFAHQWLADGTEITGATGSTYAVAATDEGKVIKVRVSFTDDAGNDESLTSTATTAVAARPNTPAAGSPTISGTAHVGETLTADASGITDADGLVNASFAYQWLADDRVITGANASTYTLAATDVGKAIKLQVSFTDDAGNEETVTSAATTAVTRPPLTATIHDKPTDSHDGENAFTFELRFSETPAEGFSYKTIRDDTFTVTGGEVVKAKRLEAGKNLRWEITVTPSGNGNVTLSGRATTDCNADGAICTKGGDKFSGLSEFTVSGPASQQQSSDDDQNGQDDQDGQDDQNGGSDEGSQDDESDETPVSLPSAPTGLTATVNSNGSITLTWTDPNDDTITGYQILRRRPAEGEGTLSVYVANTNSATTIYTDTGVTAGTQHVYRIKAINSAGTGPRSSYVNVDP